RRRLFLLLAVFVSFARAASAQDDIRTFVASLSQMQTRELAATSTGNGDHLQRAFASLELHVRSSNEPDAARALRQFKDVVKNDSLNAWAHFGMGLTLSRLRSKTAVYRVLNLDNSSALGLMESEFKRALELDSTLTEAQVALDAIKSMIAKSELPHRLISDVESTGSETPLERLHRAVTLFRAGGRDVDAAKLYYA